MSSESHDGPTLRYRAQPAPFAGDAVRLVRADHDRSPLRSTAQSRVATRNDHGHGAYVSIRKPIGMLRAVRTQIDGEASSIRMSNRYGLMLLIKRFVRVRKSTLPKIRHDKHEQLLDVDSIATARQVPSFVVPPKLPFRKGCYLTNERLPSQPILRHLGPVKPAPMAYLGVAAGTVPTT